MPNGRGPATGVRTGPVRPITRARRPTVIARPRTAVGASAPLLLRSGTLTSGMDGLAAYRALLDKMKDNNTAGGALIVDLGAYGTVGRPRPDAATVPLITVTKGGKLVWSSIDPEDAIHKAIIRKVTEEKKTDMRIAREMGLRLSEVQKHRQAEKLQANRPESTTRDRGPRPVIAYSMHLGGTMGFEQMIGASIAYKLSGGDLAVVGAYMRSAGLNSEQVTVHAVVAAQAEAHRERRFTDPFVLEILSRNGAGHSNRRIGNELSVGPDAVRVHLEQNGRPSIPVRSEETHLSPSKREKALRERVHENVTVAASRPLPGGGIVIARTPSEVFTGPALSPVTAASYVLASRTSNDNIVTVRAGGEVAVMTGAANYPAITASTISAHTTEAVTPAFTVNEQTFVPTVQTHIVPARERVNHGMFLEVKRPEDETKPTYVQVPAQAHSSQQSTMTVSSGMANLYREIETFVAAAVFYTAFTTMAVHAIAPIGVNGFINRPMAQLLSEVKRGTEMAPGPKVAVPTGGPGPRVAVR